MSNEQNVQQSIAIALVREEPLSFKECNALTIEISTAMGHVGERIGRITPGGDGGRTPVGVEYQRALKTGTAEDVQKLDDEFRDASTLLAQLKAQRDEIHARREAARLREALASMPNLQAALVDKLDAAEAAKEALKATLAAVSAAVHEIHTARIAVRVGTSQEPDGGATVHTLRRIGSLDAAFALDSPFKRHPTNWLDLIGCAVTERIYKEAVLKVPDADYADCTTDADVMRRAVETLFGPRIEDDAEVAKAFAQIPANAKERMVA